MALDLHALGFDALDPGLLAQFWGEVLGREVVGDGHALAPDSGTGFLLRFLPTGRPKTTPNQMHFDLTSTSLEDQQATVERALAGGGSHLDVGQRPEEGHVVIADPEGNECCVCEPTNRFLAGCGVLGALSSDGTRAVGLFWSAALGWPLVWDRDEETAIQSPRGGTKISWGGPPVRTKTARNRLHLDLVPSDGGDRDAEVERLLGLGATRLDDRACEPDGVVLADPGGNELCVLAPQ